MEILIILIKILSIILPLLISIAYLTLAERKVMGKMQRRRGPNIVGIFGLLQPLADGLKLFLKESILPTTSNTFIFISAPIITFTLSLLTWAVIPFGKGIVLVDINIGILYLLAISSLGVYGIICSGWASNSNYAFLGALRSSAQMISYEVSIGLIIIGVLLCAGSLNLTEIIVAQETIWYIIPLYPLFILFVVSGLAETNRPPFDLPEAEAELVSGYNVEYSGMGFALFFLGEYINIILMSVMITILFLGGWNSPFNIGILPDSLWLWSKVCLITFIFIWVRTAFPRYRYDQLMSLGWKVFLPISLAYVIIISSILISFDYLPS
jgi:NADH-quinone oxidoreductase subunit H